MSLFSQIQRCKLRFLDLFPVYGEILHHDREIKTCCVNTYFTFDASNKSLFKSALLYFLQRTGIKCLVHSSLNEVVVPSRDARVMWFQFLVTSSNSCTLRPWTLTSYFNTSSPTRGVMAASLPAEIEFSSEPPPTQHHYIHSPAISGKGPSKAPLTCAARTFCV